MTLGRQLFCTNSKVEPPLLPYLQLVSGLCIATLLTKSHLASKNSECEGNNSITINKLKKQIFEHVLFRSL